jgi:leucyl/phenylalanyl-tRNA---protein transferase
MNESKFPAKTDWLKPENMILLYSRGAFPMADEAGIIDWYMPDIRTIIFLDNFNLPRSLKKYLSASDFEYRFDTSILKVVKECSNRTTTWISDELINAYKGLNSLGHLHSVEVYQQNKLIGGLYGVTFKGAFFGESMFSRVPQASKAALVKLIEHLKECGFILLDVQYQTEHLKMFGAVEIPFEEYSQILFKSYAMDCRFS